uniref:Uncharacterized protein n=1 Tax=Rhizophora mucronata TaxID=61149 RepID=A0A2P2P7H6_RHIMU
MCCVDRGEPVHGRKDEEETGSWWWKS